MLRFLGDENLKGDIHRGLLRRQPDLDLVKAFLAQEALLGKEFCHSQSGRQLESLMDEQTEEACEVQ